MINIILDRYNGHTYDGSTMCALVNKAADDGYLDVVRAFFEDNEKDFQAALARYIRVGLFNRDLILYVYGQRWIVT